MSVELDAPMVFLAPDRHVFIVLGDEERRPPVIGWSKSWRYASELADIHGGLVVAVPVVRDSVWRLRPEERAAVEVPVPAPAVVPVATMPAEGGHGPAQPADEPDTGPLVDGYAVVGRQPRAGHPSGWSSARETEGQTTVAAVPTVPLVQRSKPFGDPVAPELPEDPEKALREAFGGGEGPEVEAALAAFRTAAQADLRTLERIRDGLRAAGDDPTVVASAPGEVPPTP